MPYKDRETYLAYQRDYSRRNREKQREGARKWREEHLDAVRQADRVRARAARKTEKRQAYMHDYVRENKERIDTVKTEWRRRNREKVLRYSNNATRKRRARKQGVEAESIDLLVLAERDKWRCHLCGREVTRETWSMDHLIPLSQGGPHTYQNVALAHRLCNTRRHLQPVEEARAWLR